MANFRTKFRTCPPFMMTDNRQADASAVPCKINKNDTI